jgi:hypothetical protein
MFDDFLGVLDTSPFEEFPVDVKTFVEDKGFLGQPPLSSIQYDIVEAMSQVYRLEDLKRFMTYYKADKHFKKFTKTEITLRLGKGSGKDHVSTIGCAYLVYKLLCLKDPAVYFGKPPGDAIDILNVAVNAQQAKNVFFKGFKTKITRSPWFRGKFDPKTESIDFDKSISVYSGHSERESHEGLNLILAVLDEISGFAMDNPSGFEKSKTAEGIYNAFRGTVDSRFSFGKVVLLSFPRYEECFISRRYKEVISESEFVRRSHTFIINLDAPHDAEENRFVLEWDEEHIISYKFPGHFALCRPTWDVNPTRSIEDFKVSFLTNEPDARARFLAQPVAVSDAMFGRRDKIASSLAHMNPLEGNKNSPLATLTPIPDKRYFMHADLAQKVDRCAIGLSHVEKWVTIDYGNGYKTVQPYVVTDAIAYWKPSVGNPVNLKEVKDWIISVRSLGFPIDLITFDRWNSADMQRDLISLGFKCETLSVAKKHYEDLMVVMYEDRLRMPNIDILEKELQNLRIIKDKVEHPRTGTGKDLSDALCGSVFNAVTRSQRSSIMEVEVHDFGTILPEKDLSSTVRSPYINVSSYDDGDEDELEVWIL